MSEVEMKVVSGSENSSITLVFYDQGHTLGNALRYMLIRNPEIDFAAYTVPHPLINEMHLRVRTTGSPALDVVDNAAQSLIDVCDHITETFDAAFE